MVSGIKGVVLIKKTTDITSKTENSQGMIFTHSVGVKENNQRLRVRTRVRTGVKSGGSIEGT